MEQEKDNSNKMDDKIQVQPFEPSLMTYIIDAITCPFTFLCCCCGMFLVNEREEKLIFRYGKYSRSVSEPGIHCAYPTMRDIINFDRKIITVDLPNTKINDSNGSPLNVSAVLNYRIVDSMKAYLNVTNYSNFVVNQALTVLKRVVGCYPYESSEENGISLKNGSKEIQDEMQKELSEMCEVAGIEIISILLNELSYSTEVASIMLKKQQAKAMVEAKQIIMEGAISLAVDTVNEIETKGITMSDTDKSRLVTNILTVSVGNSEAQPTLSLD
ncbi:hypothetical protein H8356DRAFT_1049415 [Neocallimastix lanati (nom. inval.)]|jgi:regulator of protease activity HflC (stomatin/prohibitin superfamily)|uniref:Band 7 domain-containing protein n=1 Tax=Neocallimastix californiae TaxID=1754190 RepID=A0A1Y2BVF3_9FUNG|nr:hypothetical protein H8356DRAFT_1049415 [Neocallimastix sp. JGI-2020a]ORY38741.1 hypothetical protein LY90DRAFT_672559 [Neocallimastix californiae]|eukprot:ORY38741.1 hypothetical protein LY90DRAFT_672559 [Neocallimastix californiae]